MLPRLQRKLIWIVLDAVADQDSSDALPKYPNRLSLLVRPVLNLFLKFQVPWLEEGEVLMFTVKFVTAKMHLTVGTDNQVGCSVFFRCKTLEFLVKCGESEDACLVRITGNSDDLNGLKFYSKCSTQSVCLSAQRQNFVGERIFHQCRNSRNLNRFNRNSVCSFCHKTGESDGTNTLFNEADGEVSVTGQNPTIENILESPEEYLISPGANYIFSNQNW